MSLQIREIFNVFDEDAAVVFKLAARTAMHRPQDHRFVARPQRIDHLIEVTITAGDEKITLADSALRITFAPFTLAVQGTVFLPIGDTTLEATGALVVGIEEAQALFNIHAEQNGQPASIPLPLGLKGVFLDTLGVEVGVVFVPPGVDIGVQGQFHITTQGFAANEFALILELVEEIPDPLLLSIAFEELSIEDMIIAVKGEPDNSVPEILREISARDLSLYWAEEPIVLPDGRMAQAGFGFSGFITVGTISAHAALMISAATGISGDAEISPINFHDAIHITGNGKGVSLNQALINGQWVTQRKAPIVPIKPTPQTRALQIIPAGGAVIAFNSRHTPYLNVSLQAKLFNIFSEDVEVIVTDTGFAFTLDTRIGNSLHFGIECQVGKVNDAFAFNASAVFAVDIKGDIDLPEILGFDLGSIHLDAGFDAEMTVVANSEHFEVTIFGAFWFDDWRLALKTPLKLDVNFRSLEDLPGELLRHIEQYAEEIFEDFLNEAKKLFGEAKAEGERILAAAEQDAQLLFAAAEQEAQRIIQDAEQTVEELEREVTQLEAEVEQLEQEAAQILAKAEQDAKEILDEVAAEVQQIEDEIEGVVTAAEHEVEKIAQEVEQEAEQIIAEGEALLREAEREIESIGQAIAAEVLQIEQAAERAFNAIVNEARELANSFLQEAERIFNAIERAAESVIEWTKKTAESAWNAIKKY